MSHDIAEILKWGGVSVVAFVFLFAFSAYRSVKSQASGLNRLEILDPDVDATFLSTSGPYDDWCGRHEFTWLGAYTLFVPNNPQALIAAWEKPGESTYFCLYCLGSPPTIVVDIVTGFAGDRGVTTCNHSGAMVLPSRAGHYKQALPSKDLDYLWRAHQEGVHLVQSRFGFKFDEGTATFEERFMISLVKSAQAVMARPLWPLRAMWWVLTQRLRVNRPLTRQDLIPPA